MTVSRTPGTSQVGTVGRRDCFAAASTAEARGDAVMSCVADLQDPPELIPQFVRKWEEGYKVVIGVKQGTKDPWLMLRTRKFYYWLLGRLSSSLGHTSGG